MRFITEDNQNVNLINHTLEMIKLNPSLIIRIGTDSQNFSDKTKFVTSVVYRWSGRKGAHYIFIKENITRIKDDYSRLYKEGLKTMQVYDIFRENGIKIDALEFDFNNLKKTISYKLVSDFKGWCEGLGEKAIFKSGELIATKSSDHQCRI